MLDLDSPRWTQLSHAYGAASDIPTLLRQLPGAPASLENYRDEPWFSLWSALCHQDDVYSASYAAVPHLVAYAALRAPQQRREFVLLVACIEVCRHYSDAPPIPKDLEREYFAALEKLRRLLLECLQARIESEEIKIYLGALSTVNGQPQLGNAILELPEANCCPECGACVRPLGYELH